MICTLAELAQRVKPVGEEHDLKAIYGFGSCEQGEAIPESDVDLLVDREGAPGGSILWLGGLGGLQMAVAKKIDLVTVQALTFPGQAPHKAEFADTFEEREETPA